MIPEAIHVPDIINGKKVGTFQYLIVFLCGMLLTVENCNAMEG